MLHFITILKRMKLVEGRGERKRRKNEEKAKQQGRENIKKRDNVN